MAQVVTNPDQFSDLAKDEHSLSGITLVSSDDDKFQLSPTISDYQIGMDDALEIANGESYGTDISWKSTKNTPATRRQRQAANTRERSRMKTINDAFEGLRARVPVARDDRKLSKVDTLRLAIAYIKKLSEMINVSCDTGGGVTSGRWNRDVQNRKIVIRCYHRSGLHHLTAPYSDQSTTHSSICGHSLSWRDEKQARSATNCSKFYAKTWMPDSASR